MLESRDLRKKKVNTQKKSKKRWKKWHMSLQRNQTALRKTRWNVLVDRAPETII